MTVRYFMGVLLICAMLLALLSIWRAHRDALSQFNAFDLIMENGKVSKIALAFMMVLGVTTWVIVWLTVRDKLTEGYFTAYGGMWVVPLVAKVVFNKTELPTAAAPPAKVEEVKDEVKS